ncbi:MAG TPA: S53 family peptidase [Candidatus Baltobacteraceae bacterium]|nr:S53 family peptidase [Candidatus Baltobacteraceae bacterium]
MKLPGFWAVAVLAAAVASSAAPASASFRRPPAVTTVRTLALPSQHGVFAGRLARRTTVDLYIRIAGRHDSELAAYAMAIMTPGSPYYARYLTPEQFGSFFGADPVVYNRAIERLRSRGFVIDELPENHTDIVAHAPASTVEAFFQTPLDMRAERGRTYFTNRYAPVLPRDLQIVSVSGLDDYGFHHPMLRRNPNVIINRGFSWGPDDIATAYDVQPLYDENLDGKGVTIANATCGAAVSSDLAIFQNQFSLPRAELVSTAEPRGHALSPTCGRGYSNVESSIDVDWATAIAREATFHQVVARGPSNHDFDLVYSFIVNKLGGSVHVVTTSWGACERDMKGTASLSIDEKLFAQAVAEGQHWFSASGDNGTDDCEDGGTAVSVDYPGSSRYVTSVGGTNVHGKISHGNVIAWDGETTWQQSNSNGASGGGASILYAKPAYQRGVTANDGARDVPDVSLLSDGVNDGVWMAQGGQMQGFWGGTSEAAPQWAGLFAIIQQRYGSAAVPDPHARLYQLASSRAYSRLFHDITRGNNGVRDAYGTFPGYGAKRGFDLATGWGSFIAAPLVKAY